MAPAERRRASGFPETRASVVESLARPERRRAAFERLVEAYWRPVYKYLRLHWRLEHDAAEDVTQGFFAHALEKHTLDGYDPARARFRTWLRTCLDGFVQNEKKAATRLKRGGGTEHVALAFEDAEGELRERPLAGGDDPETLFHREWMRSLVSLAVAELREASQGSDTRRLEFALFERYDLEEPVGGARPTYAALGREFGVPETRVTSALHAARRRLREAILARLGSVCASEGELRAEAAALFGGRR